MGKAGLPGSFEELVLLAVARAEGSGYGMTVRRELEKTSGRSVSIGSVYTTLDRLEAIVDSTTAGKEMLSELTPREASLYATLVQALRDAHLLGQRTRTLLPS